MIKDSVNIVVFGIGYVGLSSAVLLSQHNHVTAIDIIPEKVEMLNKRISPLADEDIIDYLTNHNLNLTASLYSGQACKEADYVIIATPTNYDPVKNYFDTSSVEDAIEKVMAVNSRAYIIVKSTVPVGYTQGLRKKYKNSNIIFSPEFLREGRALYDNLYPSRIVLGTPRSNLRVLEAAQRFALLLQEGALKPHIPTLFMHSTEAEAVKLFANTFLAVRVAYFNEVDTYAVANGLDTSHIIEGICLDPRISNNYNNPSFGYGGYCLPKDTKQLLADYKNLDQAMISAVVQSNVFRKEFIAEQIHKAALEKMNCRKNTENDRPIGIYRLTMKANSDNFREASIIDVISLLKEKKLNLVIYEPTLTQEEFEGIPVIHKLDEFKKKCILIVANRYVDELNDVQDKVFTRDIYRED